MTRKKIAMKRAHHILLVLAACLVACGEPPSSPLPPAAIVISATGDTVTYQVPPLRHDDNWPVATSTMGLVAPLAGNSATSAFTITAQPDLERSLLFYCDYGWSGGDITVAGTDSSGVISETFTPMAVSAVNTGHAWLTVTSITKSKVGATSAACYAGPGMFLGIPINRPIGGIPRLGDNSGIYNGGSNNAAAEVLQSTSIRTPPMVDCASLINNPAVGDPSIWPCTPPDGKRYYLFVAPLTCEGLGCL